MSAMRILFVCLGNICRSPIAEGIFRDKVIKAGLVDDIEIDSAGTGAWHIGSPPDKRAQISTKILDIDISNQKARQIQDEDFEYFDLLLAMDYANYETMLSQTQRHNSHKIQMFLQYAPQQKGAMDNIMEVPDPYYGGEENFTHVVKLVESACYGLLEDLKKKL